MDLEIGGFGFASLVLVLFVLNLDSILVFDFKSFMTNTIKLKYNSNRIHESTETHNLWHSGYM